MADIYLLTEAERKYFSHLTGAFSKILTKERICPQKLEMTEEQLKRVCEGLPYSPANALKKWERVLSKPYFMLMRAERYTPAPQKPDTEPLAPNEYFLSAPGGSKARYMVAAEWHYLQGDSLSTFFNTPIAHPIEETEQAYKLITEYADSMGSDAEKMNAVRNALGLSDYSYIPFGLFSTMASVAAVCKEYLKTPAEPGLSEGRKRTIDTSLQTVEAPPARYFGEGFSTIRQGVVTNALSTVRPNTRGNTVTDPITKAATLTAKIKGYNLIIQTPSYEQLAGLKTSTHQLFDALVIALTETGAKSTEVLLSLTDYMKRRGLKDRKEARKQFTDDLLVLQGINITLEEAGANGSLPIKGINITDNWEWADKKKTAISYTFGTKFYKILLGYPIMPYPDQLQELNAKKNPNSFYLLRKISELKNMNVSDINGGDVISVETLLAAAPYIPTYEEVKRGNRNTLKRIIDPFERDMDALSKTLTWEFCHTKGTPLTQAEVDGMNYDLFKGLLVKITWKKYPDQTARLERKAEQIEEAKQKKPRRKTKKRKEPAAE